MNHDIRPKNAIAHAFQSVSTALDEVGVDAAGEYLARVVVLLAQEIQDPELLDAVLRRAKVSS